jgi:hypothetical protein
MLRSIKDLRGYTIRALDGDIGRVHEFYFGDQSWIIRYLVVDTSAWLPGRRVLLSPEALGQPDWERYVLPVGLTKGQVEHSPSIDEDKPFSRKMEGDLHVYYGWRPYWSGWTSVAAASAVEAAREEREDEQEWADPNLRSTREVIGYHIQARDGEVGHVEDFVADDVGWGIRYLVVDTHNWLPGKKVLVDPFWADQVNWAERKVYLDMTREMVKTSPEFDPAAPVNREYEVRLYDFYGRPKPWE